MIHMGTNYYARIDACKHCNRSDENIHLGKLSSGWVFLFRTQKQYYNNFNDFKIFIYRGDVRIFDEYENESTPDALIHTILMSYENKENEHHERYSRMSVGSIRTGYQNIEGYDFLDTEFC